MRLRPGWFAVRTAPAAVVEAVRAGGRLTCASALRLQGVWMMPDELLHVAVSRGNPRPARDGLRVHWTDGRAPTGFPMDSPITALSHLIGCVDLRACVVAVDSALNTKLVGRDETDRLLAETPRGRRVAQLVDPASESGTETLARLALRRLRLQVRTQVLIAGVGRVDLLVGDRLVVEVDGEEWHSRESTFESDRARDRRLVARGYLVMRASYKQVMWGWDDVEAEILTVVRRNAHRWPRGRR